MSKRFLPSRQDVEETRSNHHARAPRTPRRKSLVACAGALAATFAALVPTLARADDTIVPPAVPPELQITVPVKPFLLGHGVGTQNYVCSLSGNGVAYVLVTPQATLFDNDQEQLTSHFFSPNPAEQNTNPAVVTDRMIRATWRSSRDSSTVWAEVKPGNASTNANFVATGAVAWLLLTKSHVENGPDGGTKLTKTAFIHRVNTSGGVAPATGCSTGADLGHQAFVPYKADYIFYRAL